MFNEKYSTLTTHPVVLYCTILTHYPTKGDTSLYRIGLAHMCVYHPDTLRYHVCIHELMEMLLNKEHVPTKGTFTQNTHHHEIIVSESVHPQKWANFHHNSGRLKCVRK